jgi:hypothetical protein
MNVVPSLKDCHSATSATSLLGDETTIGHRDHFPLVDSELEMSTESAIGVQSLSTTTVDLDLLRTAGRGKDSEVPVPEVLTMKPLYHCLGEIPEMFLMSRY